MSKTRNGGMLYNEERKLAYIRSCTDKRGAIGGLKNIMLRFAQRETEMDKDLCLWTTEELQSVIDDTSATRLKSPEKGLYAIRGYVEWCKNNGIEVSDGVYGVTVSVVEAMKASMVGNPRQLAEKLNKVFPDENLDTIYCLYHAYFWMIYAGLESSEALNVKAADVDYENLEINFKNKIYRLYEESQDAFRAACTLEQFRNRRDYGDGKDHWLERAECSNDERYVMRGVAAPQMTQSTIKRVISAAADEADEKISYKKIYYSGVFFRAAEKEMCGEINLFADEVATILARREEKGKAPILTRNYTANKIANKLIYELQNDYTTWKYAFSV